MRKIKKKILFDSFVIRFYYFVQYFKLTFMSHALPNEKSFLSKPLKTVCAGAIASFVTQPFQVLKTNMINCPTLYVRDLHRAIIKNGWTQYMRGGTVAVVRQGYGFTIYTSAIDFLNRSLENLEMLNKYYRYSISAGVGKSIAMMFEAPLTLLKTRIEVVSSTTLRKQLQDIMSNPIDNLARGLHATLIRELVYSVIHYTTYRFLKDEIFAHHLNLDSAFIPAFCAGTIAITLSQPLEVVRSRVSIGRNLTVLSCGRSIFMEQGWKGFFLGFWPRLCRKPINSGICWSLLQAFKQRTQESQ